jgi:hypothetical protein
MTFRNICKYISITVDTYGFLPYTSFNQNNMNKRNETMKKYGVEIRNSKTGKLLRCHYFTTKKKAREWCLIFDERSNGFWDVEWFETI